MPLALLSGSALLLGDITPHSWFEWTSDELINGTLAIPPSHVIGTEYGYMATNQGEKADADYTFQPSDQIVFDGSYEEENAKTSKVDAIVRKIGQQPVLAFGNSSGDVAMTIYTITSNPYKSAAYMVMTRRKQSFPSGRKYWRKQLM